MLNLYTRNNFAFVRQISDHTDTGTYYVQVVIRNAYTDAIIDTLNLDSKGNQRYSKIWKIPADPSGEGFYISVVSSVYTDSNYTTKSSTYGDEENTYLVVDRPNNLGGGSSFVPSGSSLVRRDVTDIVKKEVADIVPSISKMFEDLYKERLEKDSVMTAKMNEIYECVKEIEEKEMPEQEKVDLKPVLNAIESIKKDVNAIDTTIDLSPILNALEASKEDVEVTQEELQMALRSVESKINKQISNIGFYIIEKIKSNMTFSLTATMDPIYDENLKLKSKEKENEKEDDMNENEKEENDVEEDMAEKEVDLEKLTK